jgi:hypothetical protein
MNKLQYTRFFTPLSIFRIFELGFWKCTTATDIPNPKSNIGHPLSILAFFTLFSTILTAQPIYKTYPNTNGGTAIGEYNNGGNYFINTCTGNQATYLWTDGQGNMLNSESDFAGSCGQYRVDANTYIKADTVGTEPNRDIRFRKIARNGAVILEKIYAQPLDNFGQFVSPTKDGGFIIAGNTQVTADTLYRVQLTKIDANGNLQWHKTVNVPDLYHSNAFKTNRTSCNQAITVKTINIKEIGQASDGGFYITYTWEDVLATCASGFRNANFIIRTNAVGDFTWQKGKGTSEISGSIDYKILPTDNGSLYVLDSRINKGGSNFQLLYTYEFRKISANGDTLWTFSGQRNPNTVEGQVNKMHAFSLTPDNNIIAHTTETVIKNAPVVENSVIKLNGQTGRFMDSMSVSLTQSKAIITTKDGGFALVGNATNGTYFYKNKFGTPPQYCASKAVAPWEYAIANVKLGGFNNTSDKFKDINTLGYSDYTNLSTTLTKGQIYPLSITPLLSWIGNLQNAYARAWIDFNQNKIFEANELVLEKTNANPLIQNVLIPTTALMGTTRMRVSLKFGTYPTPCETFDKGEVEDYLVDITEGSSACANDVTPPVFINCRDTIFKFSGGNTHTGTYIVLNPIATDNCGTPTVTNDVGATVPFNTNSFRSFIINFTAKDAKNNTATCQQFVTLQDTCIRCYYFSVPQDTTIYIDATANCATYKWSLPSVAELCCGSFTKGGGYANLISTSPQLTVSPDQTSTTGLFACFPIGTTTVTHGYSGVVRSFKVTVVRSATSANDLALTLTATPSVYRQYTTQNFKITAKNNSTTAFSAVKIKFNRPNLTVSGGTKVASIGTFQDYCAGGIECSEWTIPTLAEGAIATLDIPVYVLNPTGGITATAALLSSNPVDNNTANNTASVTINSANAPLIQPLNQLLINSKPTQLIPIIIQKIAPTITENYIVVELESIINKTIDFEISNSLGSVVLTEKIVVEKGNNKLHFQVENLPKGLYFIQTSVGKGRGVPMKFVKM